MNSHFLGSTSAFGNFDSKMAPNFHQLLRSLCFNTDWKYAIFWKLKHRARMILTWEDAYYDNPDGNDTSENKCCQKTFEQIRGGLLSHDPLGLAVAKMSYHVYTLGEGSLLVCEVENWSSPSRIQYNILEELPTPKRGEDMWKVAVTGKHQWICADSQVTGPSSSYEFADGWQSQFSAGIKTIVVVAVVPLGVVQLGSLNKVTEDMGIVTHIRNIFLATQHYSIDHVLSQIQSVKNSSSLDAEKIMKTETLNNLTSLPFSGKNILPSVVNQDMAADMAKHGVSEFNHDESFLLLQSMSNMMNLEDQKFVETRFLNGRDCEGYNSSVCKNMRVDSTKKISLFPHNSVINNNNSFEDLNYENDKLHSVELKQKGISSMSAPSNANSRKGNLKSELQTEPSYKDASFTTLKFPAGCELYEALGPAFLNRSRNFDCEAQGNQVVESAKMPDEISCSHLTSESHQEHLLEAVVANVCHSNNDDVNSELSFTSVLESGMASGKPEASIHTMHTINSEGYSMDHSSLVRDDKQICLSSSGICGVISPKGFSSTCPSSCSEPEKSSEPSKNKKRGRAGETSRPRPRDRQLIQDRIKELRELVPNGAKCSIDSLLERTIKHMLFLQSITKHADKLNKFSDSKTKLHHMETDVLESPCYEQGSSWAMEVGGHLKVHSILVENLNKNGQMLVEMLCKECTHFLEIAEAIRSLGLTILKGATEAHGEKTWICFVVEGQNNRNVHRLDILWPLVQILQSQSTTYTQ